MLPSTSMVDSVTGLRYAEFPVPPITLLTDVVARCRLLAAHGLRSCLSVRTQPLTATGAPSQTSMVWYGMVEVCEGAPVTVCGWVLHTIPYHTIPYHTYMDPDASAARHPSQTSTMPYHGCATVDATSGYAWL